jgi:hypothetical protein
MGDDLDALDGFDPAVLPPGGVYLSPAPGSPSPDRTRREAAGSVSLTRA